MQKHRFLDKILPRQNKKSIVLITGARQTGKTTLAKSIYSQLRYVNLDAPENREAVIEQASSLWAKDMGMAVIDEAQKEPVVFDKIKYAYDEGGLSFSVILGSSQIMLLKRTRESLAGRVSIYELWPLMMSELAWDGTSSRDCFPLIDKIICGGNLERAVASVPSLLVGTEDSLKLKAENYLLKWGGMPALLPLSDQERGKWLRDYEYTYLERDLLDLARLDDLGPFRKFQKLSAARSGSLLNYSELARDASVSVDTARRYLQYLNLSYQVILLQPYFRNITSSIVKTPKLYWLDVGLLRQISGYSGQIPGKIYETMVVAELVKWIKTMQRAAEVYFYRTRSGFELDVMLQLPRGIIGLEIKAREKAAPVDCRAMKDVAAKLGSSWLGGIIVNRGRKIEKISEPDIWVIPSYRLFT